jgi:hypothetical protein
VRQQFSDEHQAITQHGSVCAGMSWIPDDAWMVVARSGGGGASGTEQRLRAVHGPVGVVFQDNRDAKVWILMLMKLQQLAWEMYLMEVSGQQLVEGTCKLFHQGTPNTEAGCAQPHCFAALRALHALLMPTRGSLSVGLKSYSNIATSAKQTSECPSATQPPSLTKLRD